MPLHDWSQVPAGLFHHFHQVWSVSIARALNRGVLPSELTALVEQRAGTIESDVLAIEEALNDTRFSGGAAVLDKPQTRFVRQTEKHFYADKANRIVIRHHLGKVVALIEIVSPGNKDSNRAIRQFVQKVTDALYQGIHVLVIDVFPPGKRDPHSLHELIWNELDEEEFSLPSPQDRLLASYETGSVQSAYIETIGVGSPLPDMPLFIAPGAHVLTPLESTYQDAWQDTPESVRRLVQGGSKSA